VIHRRRPLYSASNEDSRSELEALEISPDDTVVAICAGGGRALSLLCAGPARLVAVDQREDQLFQLELKAAAMDACDYDGCVRFLGLVESEERLDAYAEIRASLSRSARRYWDRRRGLIRRGVIYAGRCETALTHYVRGLRRLGGLGWVERLLAAHDMEEQRARLVELAPLLDRLHLVFSVYCHPLLVFAATQDPGFLRSNGGSVGKHLHRRLRSYLDRQLARESFLLHLIYAGSYGPRVLWPPWLQPQGFEAARKRLDRLELSCSHVTDFADRLRLCGRAKWSLSDVSAWMSEMDYHGLLRSLVARGASGSRLCARHFAARRRIPPDLWPRMRRLDDLGERLSRRDASIFWTFDVAEYESGPDASRASGLRSGEPPG
jgi:S-adenosylmethionine:diacylglycerol 3-amino-3-carboxypropyl transferase